MYDAVKDMLMEWGEDHPDITFGGNQMSLTYTLKEDDSISYGSYSDGDFEDYF